MVDVLSELDRCDRNVTTLFERVDAIDRRLRRRRGLAGENRRLRESIKEMLDLYRGSLGHKMQCEAEVIERARRLLTGKKVGTR